LLEKCKEIEELNLGGTQITSRTLDFISEECPNVKRLSIKGCSGFSEVDVQKLEKRGIEVEYGEGTCRFFLLSERESELPSISSNSFKVIEDICKSIFSREELHSLFTVYRTLQRRS